MADQLDLTGEIASAIDTAYERGHPVVVGYVDEDGYAAMSFRGSAIVHSPTQIALWSRRRDDGIVKEIADRPKVSLLYYGGGDGPGPVLLTARGLARVDEEASAAIYERIPAPEQAQDADRAGVAVVIDVESVRGFANGAPFAQQAS
jgi:hypothetical protein